MCVISTWQHYRVVFADDTYRRSRPYSKIKHILIQTHRFIYNLVNIFSYGNTFEAQFLLWYSLKHSPRQRSGFSGHAPHSYVNCVPSHAISRTGHTRLLRIRPMSPTVPLVGWWSVTTTLGPSSCLMGINKPRIISRLNCNKVSFGPMWFWLYRMWALFIPIWSMWMSSLLYQRIVFLSLG